MKQHIRSKGSRKNNFTFFCAGPKEGLSLVETLVASFILLLVFSGFLIGFVQATRLQYMADRNYAASVIARNRIEYAKIYPYRSLSMLVETNTSVDRYGDISPDGFFWRTTLVESAAVNSNCTEIIVKVWYETKPGVSSAVPVEVSMLIGE